eukprot:Amastigsp_a841275_466.p3 type:complete len:159 gc:universal Amastigsp_a841275_466:1016-1492(+)
MVISTPLVAANWNETRNESPVLEASGVDSHTDDATACLRKAAGIAFAFAGPSMGVLSCTTSPAGVALSATTGVTGFTDPVRTTACTSSLSPAAFDRITAASELLLTRVSLITTAAATHTAKIAVSAIATRTMSPPIIRSSCLFDARVCCRICIARRSS